METFIIKKIAIAKGAISFGFTCSLILLLFYTSSHCQSSNDSLSIKTKPYTSLALMATGIVLNKQAARENILNYIHDHIGKTDWKIDDYLQFMPTAHILINHLISNKGDKKYHIKQFAISTITTLGLTYSMKAIIDSKRPSGTSRSFPSGHTSFAFSTATVSYNILKEEQPVLAWISYAPAVTTAVMRVLRNKHWLSDVLFGAGLGIASTQLIYHIIPKRKFDHNQAKPLTNLHFGIGNQGFTLFYSL